MSSGHTKKKKVVLLKANNVVVSVSLLYQRKVVKNKEKLDKTNLPILLPLFRIYHYFRPRNVLNIIYNFFNVK